MNFSLDMFYQHKDNKNVCMQPAVIIETENGLKVMFTYFDARTMTRLGKGVLFETDITADNIEDYVQFHYVGETK